MKLRVSLLLIFGALCCLSMQVKAQSLNGIPLECRVIDDTKKVEKIKFRNNPKYGKGEIEKFENSFSAELRNTDLSQLIDGIKLRLIPFYIPFDFVDKRVGYESGKVQVKENISIAPSESKSINFDSEKFQKLESVRSSGTVITTYKGGEEYAGVVLEIYRNNSLVGVRFDGPSGLRKAYDDWLAQPAAVPEKAEAADVKAD